MRSGYVSSYRYYWNEHTKLVMEWLASDKSYWRPDGFYLVRPGRVHVRKRNKFRNWSPPIFEIGKQLALFPELYASDPMHQVVTRAAVDFFRFQCQCYRAAVDQWCLLALRVNGKVNRDIRRKVGELIWLARYEASYSQ